ncbi:MAG: hypothetical protein A3I11_05825 [Elusimicrobia bacterium RIFCSPLOWO2_02_FULL_39_32]|nr:MAG: hypothetical protein A2034_06810 [Elusimicrobia bacterium GWA2_38_7]OGR80656.1 MAG: hypothetical protein A3B80_04005 [Elusimicrobia bacterium RIFCSPHIGHO2_02_FULL_39_36]OGR91505.1 MAG: hypothetical protein A3I11_05825 [Elusimicrobia bacterium RIFCSPLOWO2_02_FULL_39_32]OGS00760.1 MAG: hypothetical protein A3G85_04425 [Elusimicrobia bacterium RIFCSPLOWO2_12_FULL_39_28]
MLTEIEKKEMLEDAQDCARREDFRRLKNFRVSISFEDHISMIRQLSYLRPYKSKRKFVDYKDIKI